MSTTSIILDQVLELLVANNGETKFKNFGDLRKSKFQAEMTEEEKDNRRQMYEGCIGNSDAAKRGHKKRKKAGKRVNKQINQKAAETRANWYKNPENLEKFKKRMKERDLKKKTKGSE